MMDTDLDVKLKDPSIRRRRLLIIAGVVLAVAAGAMAFWLSRTGTTAPKAIEPPTSPVLVAVRDVAPRTLLQAADVAVRPLPQIPALATALTEPDAAIGRVTTVPITAGQPIYPALLVTTAEGARFSILGPEELITEDTPDWRAVSVSVPPERAVGGQILAGQRVDLFATVQIDIILQDAEGNIVPATNAEGLLSGRSTKITFQDLEILSVGGDGMYILKVDLHQAEEIYHIAAASPNAFSLALRPDGDTRTTDTLEFGETTDRIIGRYLYPVPRILDLGPLTALPTPRPAEPNPTAVPAETPVAANEPTASPSTAP
jgi:Flp pilus assembly protein CpaB